MTEAVPLWFVIVITFSFVIIFMFILSILDEKMKALGKRLDEQQKKIDRIENQSVEKDMDVYRALQILTDRSDHHREKLDNLNDKMHSREKT